MEVMVILFGRGLNIVRNNTIVISRGCQAVLSNSADQAERKIWAKTQ
jgi:hypothetical protein